MKSRWFVLFPGDAYALGPSQRGYRSEKEARAAFRAMLGYSRLPKGTQLWRANVNEYGVGA